MSYYFDKEITTSSEEKEIKVIIKNQPYTFITDNNVFSKHGLDFGTRTLLENIDTKQMTGDILDFGCGYGPIGIFLARTTDACIDMIDINERAVKLSIKNAQLNNAEVNVFTSDIYSNVTKKYDYIISNPPIRVGKKILETILFEAKLHLKSKGQLIIVVNKNQGAKTLVKKLQETYDVNVIAKNKGFFVISCQNH